MPESVVSFSTFPSALPSLFFQPRRYRPHGIGYWSGHIPFACDLIYSMRPGVLVELGTHTAESYFAFCQAIAESGAGTRAYAVDTWRGDRHTGAYSDTVYNDVANFNKDYAGFSRLLRKSFEEALPEFSEESIDVLHIDGSHIYEDVKSDFDQWWPKVRPGGTVLFHDSYVREHGFGVWRLLEELRRELPGNEFVHSYGLGVITKPPAPAAASEICSWRFALADERETLAMRRYYEVCAGALHNWYLAQQRKSSDWDVVSQLLWRRNDMVQFEEFESVRASEVVGSAGYAVELPVPATDIGYAGFLVKTTLEPALLRFESVQVLTARGQELLRLPAVQTGINGPRLRGEAVLVDTPARSHFELRLPERVMSALSEGGIVQLQLRGLDPTSISGELIAPPQSSLHRRLSRFW